MDEHYGMRMALTQAWLIVAQCEQRLIEAAKRIKELEDASMNGKPEAEAHRHPHPGAEA